MERTSSKPRKQRKLLYTAPLHKRHKLLAAPLFPELRAKYNIRSFPVRKGDTVRILRGDYTGVEGKITKVDTQKYRVFIEGVTKEKADGTSFQVPINASKITLIKLNLDDKWRKSVIERKAATGPAPPAPSIEAIKPPSKPAKPKEAL